MERHDRLDHSTIDDERELASAATDDPDSPSEYHRLGRFAGFRPSRSLAIRLGLAVALLLAAILTNRSFVGWGLFAIFAILIVPVGRARSFVISFIPYTVVWFTFTFLRSLADGTVLAEKLSLKVGHLERHIFGGQLPTIMLQDRLYDPAHLHWYDYGSTFVHWSYFIVPHAVAIRTWYKSPKLYRHYLGAMTLLLSFGLILYFLIPTRPPWDTPEALPTQTQPFVFRPMTKVAEQLGGGLYAAGYRVIGESNPWAAMPSIHTAITFLLVFPAFQAGRKWGYLALIYAAMMGYSLVYLGEHFVLDVTGGVLVTTLGWLGAGWWIRRNEDRKTPLMAWLRRPVTPTVQPTLPAADTG